MAISAKNKIKKFKEYFIQILKSKNKKKLQISLKNNVITIPTKKIIIEKKVMLLPKEIKAFKNQKLSG